MNLRKQAKGRPCMMRAPGCDGGGETTVLAHIRRAGLGSMGKKPPDICGAWMCACCHDLYDGRRSLSRPMYALDNGPDNAAEEREWLNQLAFDALLRTLAALHKEGIIDVARNK